MRELEASHPDISVGSYPHFETKELIIRLLGDDPARVAEAMELILQRGASMGFTPELGGATRTG